MKIFGKRSLTAVVSRVLDVYFYANLSVVIILILVAWIGPVIKAGFNSPFHNLPLVWIGNGLMIEYRTAALSTINYYNPVFSSGICAAYFYTLFCLRRVFSNFRKYIIFSEEQARYIKRIAFSVILLDVVPAVYEFIFSRQLIDYVNIENVIVTRFPIPGISLGAIFWGIFLLILSCAVKHSIKI